MKEQFEYRYISGDRMDESQLLDFLQKLNTAGVDGWEVVSHSEIEYSISSLLKREIPQPNGIVMKKSIDNQE